jgi:hypothetical protein
MNELSMIATQSMYATFSLIILYFSFRSLNSCTKQTNFLIRITLILYLTSSVGTLLALAAGAIISWPFGLVIIATASHLGIERRRRAARREVLATPQSKV